MGELVRWSNSVEGRQAARVFVGPAGAKGSPLVSMCQIASVEFAGDLDPGDLGAALAAEAGLGALVVIDVDGVAGGVDGGFDQRPAQVLGAVLGQLAAPVLAPGLVDPGAQPGVAGQLLRATRTG